jgi:hypothetical protein
VLKDYRPGDGPMWVVSAEVKCAPPDAWGPFGPTRTTPCRSAATDSALIPFARAHNAEVYEPGRSSAADASADGRQMSCFVSVNGFSEMADRVRVSVMMTCPPRDSAVGGFIHQLTYDATRVDATWRIRQIRSFIT